MAHHGWRIGSLVLAASLALAGCSSDGDTASVSGGDAPASPAAPAAPQSPAPANAAPQVSGTPVATANLGEAWSFQPAATDPDGDTLTWSIAGKPADATFSPATGALSWTPGSSGTWSNIVITATDSRGASASLPAFSLLVNGTQQAAGSATLTWDIPQQYSDGTPLLPEDQVAGYRVYHGTSEAQMDTVVSVSDPGTVSYTAQGLTAGTHYFSVSAVSASGVEGQRSEVLTKSVM